MGNGTTATNGLEMEVSDEAKVLLRARRILSRIATDKEQSDMLRRFARQAAGSINDCIGQLADEQSG